MAKHAFLSASASYRWLSCPPSAKLFAEQEDQVSPYAKEGTDAHSLCEYKVEKALGRNPEDPTDNLDYYNNEMENCAESYCSYVICLMFAYNRPHLLVLHPVSTTNA